MASTSGSIKHNHKTLTCNEAMLAASTLIRWCEEHDIDVNNVLILKYIQEKAMTDCMRKNKQKTITDFLYIMYINLYS